MTSSLCPHEFSSKALESSESTRKAHRCLLSIVLESSAAESRDTTTDAFPQAGSSDELKSELSDPEYLADTEAAAASEERTAKAKARKNKTKKYHHHLVKRNKDPWAHIIDWLDAVSDEPLSMRHASKSPCEIAYHMEVEPQQQPQHQQQQHQHHVSSHNTDDDDAGPAPTDPFGTRTDLPPGWSEYFYDRKEEVASSLSYTVVSVSTKSGGSASASAASHSSTSSSSTTSSYLRFRKMWMKCWNCVSRGKKEGSFTGD